MGEAGGCPTGLLTYSRAWPACRPQKPFTPAKYFSIDRVFRNETLDATHLAEFHQIEGVVADHGLTLGHLMGVLREFFTKLGRQAGPRWAVLVGPRMPWPPGSSSTPLFPRFPCPGITQLRFKPAYNPYTEPSMEVFSYHQGQGGTWSWEGEGCLRLPTLSPGPFHCQAHSQAHCQTQHHPHDLPCPSPSSTGLRKWVEVGNSGIFRPEMLLPMGLPENVSVIAWGLSLER